MKLLVHQKLPQNGQVRKNEGIEVGAAEIEKMIVEITEIQILIMVEIETVESDQESALLSAIAVKNAITTPHPLLEVAIIIGTKEEDEIVETEIGTELTKKEEGIGEEVTLEIEETDLSEVVDLETDDNVLCSFLCIIFIP